MPAKISMTVIVETICCVGSDNLDLENCVTTTDAFRPAYELFHIAMELW